MSSSNSPTNPTTKSNTNGNYYKPTNHRQRSHQSFLHILHNLNMMTRILSKTYRASKTRRHMDPTRNHSRASVQRAATPRHSAQSPRRPRKRKHPNQSRRRPPSQNRKNRRHPDIRKAKAQTRKANNQPSIPSRLNSNERWASPARLLNPVLFRRF
jgi:hypothetical protein